MSPDSPHDQLPDSISAEATHERSFKGGARSDLHKWWARRPALLARITTYLALTEKQAPDHTFLSSLGAVNPSSTTLAKAIADVRDARWLWAWREEEYDRERCNLEGYNPWTPSTPKVLDPFAGAGSIPWEALQLGCDAYASDLNPVAYLILRATIEYPARFASANSEIAGSGSGGTWNGLVEELKFWALRLKALAEPRVESLFGLGVENQLPAYYIWCRVTRCHNQTCRSLIPIQSSCRLSTNNADRATQLWVRFQARSDSIESEIVNQESAPRASRHPVCVNCGKPILVDSLKDSDTAPILAALVTRSGRKTAYMAVHPEERNRFAPWTPENTDRTEALLALPLGRHLQRELPGGPFEAVKRRGAKTFRDLFSPRQFLVALEYSFAISEVREEMLARGLLKETVDAVLTYLGFFLGDLVDTNSMLCDWDLYRQVGSGSFTRAAPVLSCVFVERVATGLVDKWLATTLPAIQSRSSIQRVGTVRLCDAAQLPFDDGSFDAIVTDPPYYDSIPYSELADFFWVWECGVNTDLQTSHGHFNEAELVENRASRADQDRKGLLPALRESFRVLKPGRLFAMLLTSRTRNSFEEYVGLAQQSGFDLVNVKTLREKRINARRCDDDITFLIYFRKPHLKQLRENLKANPTAVLEAAESGKSVLYEGLAKLLLDELDEDDITDLIPQGAKGTRLEMVMEVVAEEDPRALLSNRVGLVSVRGMARKLGLNDKVIRERGPIDALLSHFGFSLPSPVADEGLSQVQQRLARMITKIRLARDREDIRGPFLDGCIAIERLLRMSVWGWAELAFRSDRDRRLLEILSHAGSTRKATLDRLTFGDVVALFRGLPDAIAQSEAGNLMKNKFGRPHPYLPNNRQTKLAERLGKIVPERNRAAHDDKEEFWNITPLVALRDHAALVLDSAITLLDDMALASAVPRLVVAIQEIRDQWNRITYRLNLDNGQDVEARFTKPINLGKHYLYFGSGTNPRPVDPLALPVESLGRVPEPEEVIDRV